MRDHQEIFKKHIPKYSSTNFQNLEQDDFEEAVALDQYRYIPDQAYNYLDLKLPAFFYNYSEISAFRMRSLLKEY